MPLSWQDYTMTRWNLEGFLREDVLRHMAVPPGIFTGPVTLDRTDSDDGPEWNVNFTVRSVDQEDDEDDDELHDDELDDFDPDDDWED